MNIEKECKLKCELEEYPKPNKAGYFWYECEDGSIGLQMTMIVCNKWCYVIFMNDIYPVQEFEEKFKVKRWVGEAHLPKKADRYDVELCDCKACYGYKYIVTENGYFVRYEDVKEFLK